MTKLKLKFHKFDGEPTEPTSAQIIMEGHEGDVYLSGECITIAELENIAGYYHSQLDAVVKQARAKFISAEKQYQREIEIAKKRGKKIKIKK